MRVIRQIGLWLVLTLVMVVMGYRAPAVNAQSVNLLTNPSFEDGYYFQDGIPELATPNGWRLHYLDGSTFAGIAEGAVARRPESVVWPRNQAPASEQNVFWRDGTYIVKLFKPWAPVYFGMSQTVSGLTPGAQYEFVARVYVDIVQQYDDGNKIVPSNEPEGVGVRLGNSLPGATWRDAGTINYGGFAMQANTSPFHQTYITLRHRFTATGSQQVVWLEMYSRYGYANNGFFMDNFELIPVGGSVAPPPTNAPLPTATPQPGATSTPVPTAAPTQAPTAAPAPVVTYTEYRVQVGDSLTQIARRFGVSVTEIARVNNITNTSLIFVGTLLRIPTAGTGAPIATTPPTSGGTTATATPVPVTGGSGSRTYVVQAGDRLSTIAQKLGVPYSLLVAANNISNPNLIYAGQVLVVPDASRIYTVQVGDTLKRIADRYGTTWEAIATANRLANANVIYPGQILTIP